MWDYIRTWWIPTCRDKLVSAEAFMLKGIDGDIHVEDVPSGSDGHTVHTIRLRESATDGHKRDAAPVVLFHGFAMGAASWTKNLRTFHDVGAEAGREVMSIDWPGSGLSSRPEFPKGRGIDACEDFFVERIEAWRQSLGIKRMIMVGHSFGGYFSACYAIKYPQHVERLVLASPVGMGDKKTGSTFTDPAARAELPWKRRLLLGTVEHMWTSYWTPQAVVRVLGPFGGRPVDYYVTNRFAKAREAGTTELSDDAMKDYMYHLAAQPGCAELCLGELLEFGAWAKRPVAQRLVDKFATLGTQAPPVALVYGQHDWMDSATGLWIASNLANPTDVIEVIGAGHQVFVDNPRAFNAAVHRAMGSGPEAVDGLYRCLHSTPLASL